MTLNPNTDTHPFPQISCHLFVCNFFTVKNSCIQIWWHDTSYILISCRLAIACCRKCSLFLIFVWLIKNLSLNNFLSLFSKLTDMKINKFVLAFSLDSFGVRCFWHKLFSCSVSWLLSVYFIACWHRFMLWLKIWTLWIGEPTQNRTLLKQPENTSPVTFHWPFNIYVP